MLGELPEWWWAKVVIVVGVFGGFVDSPLPGAYLAPVICDDTLLASSDGYLPTGKWDGGLPVSGET
ncbi:hypothetical protein E2C01_031290 [Portunus trituberculatus]|uniref:Uncharacterized protein n=1 Tax=Portunus trituberculatus TaxID=210409 RepID=A0A5B7EXQ9_PORTR|nr:hypothetical protein [Portunus trituberculatus]